MRAIYILTIILVFSFSFETTFAGNSFDVPCHDIKTIVDKFVSSEINLEEPNEFISNHVLKAVQSESIASCWLGDKSGFALYALSVDSYSIIVMFDIKNRNGRWSVSEDYEVHFYNSISNVRFGKIKSDMYRLNRDKYIELDRIHKAYKEKIFDLLEPIKVGEVSVEVESIVDVEVKKK